MRAIGVGIIALAPARQRPTPHAGSNFDARFDALATSATLPMCYLNVIIIGGI